MAEEKVQQWVTASVATFLGRESLPGDSWLGTQNYETGVHYYAAQLPCAPPSQRMREQHPENRQFSKPSKLPIKLKSLSRGRCHRFPID